MPKQVRILIIDDHPLMRQGAAAIIRADERFTVVGECDEAKGAFDIINQQRPDVVLLDLTLKSGNGLELLKDIKVQFPELPVLILSMHEDKIYAPRALRAGAAGYLNKSEAVEKLISAINSVLSGDIYLTAAIKSQMLQRIGGGRSSSTMPTDILTDRELEVLEMIGHGSTTREIAMKLGLSVKTVETHRAHLKEKLGLQRAPELVHYAINWVNGEGNASNRGGA